MFSYLKGIITNQENNNITLECNSIGYTLQVKSNFPKFDNEVSVYTTLLVTDNDVSLYGFVDNEEKEFFNQLLKLKGIGPKTALSIISKVSFTEFKSLCSKDKLPLLLKLPGISNNNIENVLHVFKSKTKQRSKKECEIISILRNMGYKPDEIESINYIIDANSNLSNELLVKLCLTKLIS